MAKSTSKEKVKGKSSEKTATTKKKTTTKKVTNAEKKVEAKKPVKKEIVMVQKQIVREKEEISNKKAERLFCLIVGALFVAFLILAINMVEFVPACLITLSLELFSICYYYRDNDNKKLVIYTLFGIGVGLLIFAVIFTIVNTI